MDLQIEIDRAGAAPLHRQLAERLRRDILEGRLTRGQRISSSRHFAESIGVSRTVVVTAFDELVAEGCLETRRGSGTFVFSMPATRIATTARWPRFQFETQFAQDSTSVRVQRTTEVPDWRLL
jgi:GntR family transcriptional regulator/MocR family aminotransferase